MPRQARKKSKTGIYHIIARGNNRQNIFEDDEDCIKFIEIIQQSKEKSGIELYGYCLMGNHVHLLLREGMESLSLTMQRICSSFVYWYNWKYDRFGHLFQERYKSEVVENEVYLITVLRYIHQNPIKAGITNSVAGYRWSSYHEYIHKQNIIDTELILELFATEKQIAKKEFEKYMNEKNKDECLEYEERHRITDKEIIKLIEEEYGVKKGLFHLLGRQEKEMILKNLKEINGITIRQLARITGVSKYMVEKA
ncbi:REP element-mobilizing transposase RayT [Anaerovirgula multivorans]|uniref:REP element-mobilizing transposase RayT n=1 Tax=Anaerovirgula multivorans TaxID=312168 RepID=A0A239CES1_9FIRM|nr:transposase [Anaerovirgula multivorans]SNS17964.1 REP element-mobilizing transposase RayT [Anaerovirgula multivorans]